MELTNSLRKKIRSLAEAKYRREYGLFVAEGSKCVADTVGAGDSFTGAFISSILKGHSLRDAHATAVKTSAFVCTQQGAMPKVPAEYLA